MTSSPTSDRGGSGSAATVARLIAVGVLSDSHGHLYPDVKESLRGVTHIIHAGDIGAPQVLAELRTLAPVTAVRGNCDYEAWAAVLPERAELELGGIRILVGHVPAQTRAWAAASLRDGRPAFAVVVSGHSHQAAVERSDGVLYVNPGSAGPRRFNRPRTVARLLIRPADGGRPPFVQAEILTVDAA